MRTRQRVSAATALVLSAALALTGCATSDDDASPAASASGTPKEMPSALDLAIHPVAHLNLEGKKYDAPLPAKPADPAGTGKAVCRRLTIAVAGDLTSKEGIDGAGIAKGVQMAVEKHNAKNPRCQLVLAQVDSKGNTVTATNQARKLAGNKNVVAVIGPLTSSDAMETGDVFHKAGLVTLSPSATAPTLTDKDWQTFFRGVNNDDIQGEAMGRYLAASGRKRVCVISDETDGSASLARAVSQGLGKSAVKDCAVSARRGDLNYAPRLAAITKALADGVFFAGTARDAGPLALALKKALPQIQFSAGDESNNLEFLALANQAAPEVEMSCSCAPDPTTFAGDYTTKFGMPPVRYALEAYDLATIVIRGIASGRQTRGKLRDFVANYDGDGVSRHYSWAPTGELLGNNVWLYKVGLPI
ncbi:MAG: branched-chain amino acid ABC transporter substrate-binding protein [Gordonia sp. (in: high G+C Gram-positive bacteria)]|uniref:branched-chain amino acid ABC transporter substrate-binding protein n=1 Tax=Gordonia sp. (in: high G+C Gram-positive bacteria) TaxID=84139 RepID=UPI0039E49EEC